jgi:hypothetical protein
MFANGATLRYVGPMTQEVVALIRDERDRAIETLRQIEEEDLVIYEAQGDSPMRDVTDKRANRQRQIIERMDRLIAALEREGALADQAW